MALEPDIVERVRRDFGTESEQAMDLLQKSGQTGRIARCIIVASRGSVDLLGKTIEQARLDFRDAIAAGEYDSAQRQIRDLRASFLLDSPEKFWLSGVACTMALRGYTLMSLESRPATAPPFVHSEDSGEGRARFIGPEGEIELEKRDRLWSIRGDPKDLETHNVDRVFEDEAEFRDAVSGYILRRRHPRA
jgi:hypothetical protein